MRIEGACLQRPVVQDFTKVYFENKGHPGIHGGIVYCHRPSSDPETTRRILLLDSSMLSWLKLLLSACDPVESLVTVGLDPSHQPLMSKQM